MESNLAYAYTVFHMVDTAAYRYNWDGTTYPAVSEYHMPYSHLGQHSMSAGNDTDVEAGIRDSDPTPPADPLPFSKRKRSLICPSYCFSAELQQNSRCYYDHHPKSTPPLCHFLHSFSLIIQNPCGFFQILSAFPAIKLFFVCFLKKQKPTTPACHLAKAVGFSCCFHVLL